MSSPESTQIDSTTGQVNDQPDAPEGRVVGEGELDTEAVIDLIERARHPATEAIKSGDHEGHRARKPGEGRPPKLRLPGFGEPLDTCGEEVIASQRFCVNSGKTKSYPRNCLRYDCPQHAPYAIRRRVSGSKSGSGIAPQLKTLISWLYSYRDTDHYFHHLFISPPEDYWLESDNPLGRLVGIGDQEGVIPEILKELGAQGLVAFHPYRAENEEPDEGDRGFWKDFLFHQQDWSQAKDELSFEPHFHVLCIAPEIDVMKVDGIEGREIAPTEQIEDETGWVIHRRQDDNGRSVVDYDRKTDDYAMCRVASYVLSHAGIYSPEGSDQRRLAAWMKGPDVNKPEVYEGVKTDIQDLVHEAAQDTLGIAPPDLECDCDYHRQLAQRDDQDAEHDDRPDAGNVDPTVDLESGGVSMRDLQHGMTPPEPDATGSPGPSGMGGGGANTDLPPNRRATELPNRSSDWAGSSRNDNSGATGAAAERDNSGAPPAAGDDQDDRADQDAEHEDCGAYLKHISQAPEYLTDPEWRENAPYADELEDDYEFYYNWMVKNNLDPNEEPKIPEEKDDPPPD